MLGDLVPRAVTPNILAALSDTPVVVVNGPRQNCPRHCRTRRSIRQVG
jgi:formyltetrahydrofolate synthetase